MEVKNLKENKNALFSRNEIEFEVENNVVPSANEVRELIAKKFSCDSGLIRIRKIDAKFGSQIFKITADIYDSQEEFDRIVKKTKHEIEKEKKAAEMKAEEEKKAAEEAAKPKEEEKPAEEEPKEETPVEEKKEKPAQEESKQEEKKE